MRKFGLLGIFARADCVPVAHGQQHEFPGCSHTEILVLFSTLLDFDSLGGAPIETIDDLIENGRSQLEKRDFTVSLLPLCAEAIGTQRQSIMLKGDLVGYKALSLASLSDDENPYVIRGRIDEKRLAELALGMTSENLEEERSPDDGGIPLCSREENNKLDELVSDFQDTHRIATDAHAGEQWITAVDNLLVWRDENMPQLPECAQAIELGYLLNKVATDSAAMFAFNYAGVSQEDNPYFDTVTLAMRGLESWRDDLKLTRPEYEGATVLALGQAGALPSCTPNELASVHSLVVGKVMDVIISSQSVETAADLIAYGEAHIGLRDGTLAGLPICQEIFEIGWLARQVLGDIISRNALNLFGFPTERNPFSAQVDAKMGGISAWREETEEYLSGIEVIKDRQRLNGNFPSVRMAKSS